MTTHYTTSGIILRSEDRGEADRVFAVFTRDYGKLLFWAIAERKITSKLRGGLELFSLSNLEFIQGKNRKVVTEAITVKPYSSIRKDVAPMYVAYRIADLVDFLCKGEESEQKLWSLLEETFDALNVSKAPYTPLYYYFLFNALEVLGYKPSQDHCAECANRFAIMLQYVYPLTKDRNQFEKVQWKGEDTKLLSSISRHYLTQFV
tara:strand:- start:708 stop:1322 length:615 start_codon:yes stop_codon:yes gene_type:complete